MAFLEKTYLDRNYNSKNPLRRYAHRTRFKKSIESIDLQSNQSLLDFGAGDGLFLNQLKRKFPFAELIGFEPYMESIGSNEIPILKNWNDVLQKVNQEKKFDFVTCFEVLEHFSPENQHEAVKKMHSITKEDGIVIISVPIEKGFPALIKNMIRRINMPQSNHIFSWKNIFDSLQGRDLLYLRKNDGYLSHMGFYFTDLESILSEYFQIHQKRFSPIGGNSHHINSQVFYKLRKK